MNYGFKIGVIDVFEQTSLSKSTFYDDETGKHLFKEITHLFNRTGNYCTKVHIDEFAAMISLHMVSTNVVKLC